MKMVSQRALGIVLAISLAFNFLIVGSVVGFFASGHQYDAAGQMGNPGKAGRANAGGPPILGALMSEFDRDTRRNLLRNVRDAQRSAGQDRRAVSQMRQDLAAALRSEPFDKEGASVVLMGFASDMAGRTEITHNILLQEIANMSAEQRGRLADALLKRRGSGRRP